jgi:hypothetical protein|nr:MAG TPA: hypothetical protein [Caudoviricetes sp.]
MLVLDNINSVSDVITNSSSELFVINDKNTTLDHLKNIINPILDGYYEPFVFNLDTFRKWVESSEEDNSTDIDACFQTIYDWFIDLEYPSGLTYYIRDTLYKLRLEDYIKLENSLLKELYAELIKKYDTNYPSYKEIEAFLQTYDEDKINKIIDYLLNANFEYDIRKLNGKIILLSEEENSISCSRKFNRSEFAEDSDVFQWLEHNFNITYYHLG